MLVLGIKGLGTCDDLALGPSRKVRIPSDKFPRNKVALSLTAPNPQP